MAPFYQTVNGACSVSGTLLVLATITFSLRLWARHRQRNNFGADDYVMGFAFLTFLGTVISVFFGVTNHFIGVSEYTPDYAPTPIPQKTDIAIDMLVAAAFGLVKLSVLFFYKRIFSTCDKASGRWDLFRITNMVLIVLVSLWTFAYFILPALQCGPHVSDYWSSSGNRYCKIGYVWLLSQSVSDFIFEFLIMILPIPKIMSLHMSRQRKLGICLIFLTAFISLGASAARLVVFVEAEKLLSAKGAKAVDAGYFDSGLFYLQVFESGVAIFAANLPHLYFWRAAVSPEKVLRSMRSMISIFSVGEGTKDRASNDLSEPEKASSSGGSTKRSLSLPEHKRSFESTQYSHRSYQESRNAITVKNEIQQTVESV